MRVVKHWNRPRETQNSENKFVKNVIHTGAGLGLAGVVGQNTSRPPAYTKL